MLLREVIQMVLNTTYRTYLSESLFLCLQPDRLVVYLGRFNQ